jgi:hypothetical protein
VCIYTQIYIYIYARIFRPPFGLPQFHLGQTTNVISICGFVDIRRLRISNFPKSVFFHFGILNIVFKLSPNAPRKRAQWVQVGQDPSPNGLNEPGTRAQWHHMGVVASPSRTKWAPGPGPTSPNGPGPKPNGPNGPRSRAPREVFPPWRQRVSRSVPRTPAPVIYVYTYIYMILIIISEWPSLRLLLI